MQRNTTMPRYQVLPALSEEEYAALKADIKERGVLVPVELDGDGNILDGHHRVQIAEELGKDYPTVIRLGMTEEEKRSHIRRLNLARRHLSRKQKRELIKGQLKDTPEYSNNRIAQMLGVTVDTVISIRRDMESKGELSKFESLIGADGKEYPGEYQPRRPVSLFCHNGQAVARAQEIIEAADTGDEVAQEMVKQLDSGRKTIHAGHREIRRAERRASVKARAQAVPEGVFNVIVADPPWQYDNTIAKWGAAELHYPTMPLADICDLLEDIGLQVADDAVLFLWTTNPLLKSAFEVVKAWDFTYKTNLVWVKTDLQRPGSGWYVRGRHELCLICTRGAFTPLDEHISPPIGSVVAAPVREHSRKPEELYEIIERLYPGCSYIELFAGGEREGWQTWGTQH